MPELLLKGKAFSIEGHTFEACRVHHLKTASRNKWLTSFVPWSTKRKIEVEWASNTTAPRYDQSTLVDYQFKFGQQLY
jgi:hypothetical protein